MTRNESFSIITFSTKTPASSTSCKKQVRISLQTSWIFWKRTTFSSSKPTSYSPKVRKTKHFKSYSKEQRKKKETSNNVWTSPSSSILSKISSKDWLSQPIRTLQVWTFYSNTSITLINQKKSSISTSQVFKLEISRLRLCEHLKSFICITIWLRHLSK